MHIRILILLISVTVASCSRDASPTPPRAGPPTRATGSSERSFHADFDTALESYRNATNAQSAKVALQAWEKVLADYEKAGTKRIQLNYHKMVLYGRLYAVHQALGETNEVADCKAKLTQLMAKEHPPGAKLGDFEPFFASVEKIDAEKKVKWRENK